MNFVAKQVLKNKTGGVTDKIDELTKKCKDLLEPDTSEPAQPPVLTEEERATKEDEIKKAHYAAFNNKREEKRNTLRDKYGLSAPEPVAATEPEPASSASDDSSTAECKEKQTEEKKDSDCCLM